MRFLFSLVFLFAFAGTISAQSSSPFPSSMVFGGRLTDSEGIGMVGPVNIDVDFFSGKNSNDPVFDSPKSFANVELKDGVFQIDVGATLTEAEKYTLFHATSEAVWILVSVNKEPKMKQQFNVVPYALRVPVDNATIGYDSNGKLMMLNNDIAGTGIIQTINTSTAAMAIDATHLPSLGGDVSGSITSASVDKIKGRTISDQTPNSGEFLSWDSLSSSWKPVAVLGALGGTVTNIATGAGLTGGPISGSGTISVVDGGIDTSKLADNAVTSEKIANGVVTSAKITNLGVDTANINTGAVTPAKIQGCSDTQILKMSGANWVCSSDANSGGTVTSVASGTGLTGGPITGTGTLSLATSGVTAGTYTKVTVDTYGRATSGTSLAAGDLPSSIDAAKIGSGAVSNAEFGYLDGVTAAIQTQIDGKASSSHTQAATTVGSGLVSDAEFGYLDGVTSAIQTQFSGKVAGPASATDNAIARFHGATGKLVQDSFVVINDSGNVGIHTSSPGSSTALDVVGQIRSSSSSNSDGAVNFAFGNVVTTTYNCASNITFANLRDGGSYTVIVTDSGTTTCSFNTVTTGDDANTVTYRFSPLNGARAINSHTVYSLMRVGTIVYVSWITNF